MTIDVHQEKESERVMSQEAFAIEGMTCAPCSMRVEKGLKKVPGVIDAQMNLATEKATVTYDPGLTGVEPMVQKVEAVGYKATPLAAPAALPSTPEQEAQTILALSSVTVISNSLRLRRFGRLREV